MTSKRPTPETTGGWRLRLPSLGEELADIALFLFALAQMHDVDLDTEIQRKMAVNAGREYVRDDNGVPVKGELRR